MIIKGNGFDLLSNSFNKINIHDFQVFKASGPKG